MKPSNLGNQDCLLATFGEVFELGQPCSTQCDVTGQQMLPLKNAAPELRHSKDMSRLSLGSAPADYVIVQQFGLV